MDISRNSMITADRDVTSNTQGRFWNIRPARKEDVALFTAVEMRSIPFERRLEGPGYTLPELTRVWTQRFRSGKYTILVAVDRKDDSRVMGFLGAQIPEFREAYINALYIDPPHMRKGLASALLLTCETVCYLNHCSRIKLCVEPMNTSGIRFYLKHGFTKTDEKVRHLNVYVKEYSIC
ncbi:MULTISPECIES: GNAT family N-acetyltransferase [unclassified Anaerobiospirillum]|uniref:GNAT family N-acetyltransferase n=1 Tax=unclassified Anaerobiospirillum TaxID=2647410 RepID=UPI001FF37988|nr:MULTISPECIES: GNAT family N-acetyltransferase [unclassified Anaerobiospirillum]MCK0525948.1 GNAT family N-acetyltransferase [Anaerobiospirillum sp. NML120449]MCK0534031.1 GNAT family N-acetyltransferase [Anaerobiospirillum sp. NML120511]MCK0539226.1 GNAT family N-acetyltransferase [Anaerobiospirillum sp. NML02-A-032]